MLFRVRTTKAHYENQETIGKLSQLGFKFSPSTSKGQFITECDITMEISDLHELMSIVDNLGPIIIHDQEEIEIYDAYRE